MASRKETSHLKEFILFVFIISMLIAINGCATMQNAFQGVGIAAAVAGGRTEEAEDLRRQARWEQEREDSIEIRRIATAREDRRLKSKTKTCCDPEEEPEQD